MRSALHKELAPAPMGSGSSHLQSADPGEMMVQEPNGCQLEDCILLGEAGLLFSSGLLLPGGGTLKHTMKIRKHFYIKDNGNLAYSNLWDAVNCV